ncbi:MAG: Uma2 family endonuclease [Planctomycetaceae bacterium]
MVATTQIALVTAEQFMEMDLGDGNFELVRGEVIRVSPGDCEHGFVCAMIAFILIGYGKQSGYGRVMSNDSPVRTERNPDTVRGADVMFYSHARLQKSRPMPKLPNVAPDLTVEVYSPSNRPSEIIGKVHEYLNAGVLMVWVVHPERRNVVIYRPDDPTPTILTENDVLEDLPELPGFRCSVSEFFE